MKYKIKSEKWGMQTLVFIVIWYNPIYIHSSQTPN